MFWHQRSACPAGFAIAPLRSSRYIPYPPQLIFNAPLVKLVPLADDSTSGQLGAGRRSEFRPERCGAASGAAASAQGADQAMLAHENDRR